HRQWEEPQAASAAASDRSCARYRLHPTRSLTRVTPNAHPARASAGSIIVPGEGQRTSRPPLRHYVDLHAPRRTLTRKRDLRGLGAPTPCAARSENDVVRPDAYAVRRALRLRGEPGTSPRLFSWSGRSGRRRSGRRGRLSKRALVHLVQRSRVAAAWVPALMPLGLRPDRPAAGPPFPTPRPSGPVLAH